MRRLSFLLVPIVSMLMLAASPVLASADATRSPEVRTLDRKIRTAEHRIRLWNHRLDRWHGRIAGIAVTIGRLTERVEQSEPITLEGGMHGFPTRELWSHRLDRAHERMRATLRSRIGRVGRRELDAWTATLSERIRERERVLRRDHDPAPQVETEPAQELWGPLTYESWARGFLAHVSAPDCSDNLLVVVAWETSESTDAAFNPLATTHEMEGATDFNSVGVKNFRSLEQGLDASRDTLQGGADSYGYAAILSSLQACAPAKATAEAINASAWCRGCTDGAYLTGLLPIVRDDYGSHAARIVATGA